MIDQGTLIPTLISHEFLRGALELEQTGRGVKPHRLPARARAQCMDPQLAMAESQPSGVRLVFRTQATHIDRCPADTVRLCGCPAAAGRCV